MSVLRNLDTTLLYSSCVIMPVLTERSSRSLIDGSILSTNTYLPSFSTSLPASAATPADE